MVFDPIQNKDESIQSRCQLLGRSRLHLEENGWLLSTSCAPCVSQFPELLDSSTLWSGIVEIGKAFGTWKTQPDLARPMNSLKFTELLPGSGL